MGAVDRNSLSEQSLESIQGQGGHGGWVNWDGEEQEQRLSRGELCGRVVSEKLWKGI